MSPAPGVPANPGCAGWLLPHLRRYVSNLRMAAYNLFARILDLLHTFAEYLKRAGWDK